MISKAWPQAYGIYLSDIYTVEGQNVRISADPEATFSGSKEGIGQK